ncbi:hypothetical protein LEP1GSC076_2513 [Leptospira sp. Fiocruz LV4135]|nr:hypothetical protein LEP1GSC076_2513 [Leptospira sp. Fiocruz LV4135]
MNYVSKIRTCDPFSKKAINAGLNVICRNFRILAEINR